jgi:hypothetical protein
LERLSEDQAQLRHDVEKIADRANVAPRKIATEDDLDVVGTLVKDARALFKKTDGIRTEVKAPHLEACRTVDTYFATLTDRLKRIGDTFQKLGDDYQRTIAAEAKRKAEATAREAREEQMRRDQAAAKAEEEGRLKHAAQHDAKAQDAAERAEQAEAVANSSAADLTRTRTASGTLATAKTEWAFEIVQFEAIPLDKLRSYIKRDAVEAAIRMAVEMGNRELPGVRIFEDVKASFR